MAPIGYEVVRVTDPIISLRADAALLFTVSETDRAQEYLKKIRAILSDADIESQVIPCDVTDTAAVLDQIGAIVSSASRHEYFFNASTGAKTACIAGILAGMLWPVQPYHVPVDYTKDFVHLPRDQPVKGPPSFIPTFRVQPLEPNAIMALDLAAKQNAPVAKAFLIRELRRLGVLAPRKGEKVTPQAFQAQANGILHRLEQWGFVELRGRGSQFRIHVTDKGKAGARMFKHVLDKPTPPSILL
jgi:hypothetical protein